MRETENNKSIDLNQTVRIIILNVNYLKHFHEKAEINRVVNKVRSC